jgi:transcriptional regulator GlxA family with amidase domain
MRLDGTILLSRRDFERIEQGLLYVEKYYHRPISADHLALEVNLSKVKLQEGIRRRTGHTLHGYLLKVRIENVKILLADPDRPLKSIALATGFKSASHLIRTFRRFHSFTPRQYRLQIAV